LGERVVTDHRPDDAARTWRDRYVADDRPPRWKVWLSWYADLVSPDRVTVRDLRAERDSLERERYDALTELSRTQRLLDETQLDLIEARNPGIDREEVRRSRDAHPGGRDCDRTEEVLENYRRRAAEAERQLVARAADLGRFTQSTVTRTKALEARIRELEPLDPGPTNETQRRRAEAWKAKALTFLAERDNERVLRERTEVEVRYLRDELTETPRDRPTTATPAQAHMPVLRPPWSYLAPTGTLDTGDDQCKASVSGYCLAMTEGGSRCPPGECDVTPDTGDET
jgi:hypothetical protein